MKVPQNFSASATKKVNPLEAAIAGNFTRTEQSGAGQGSDSAQSQILNANTAQTAEQNQSVTASASNLSENSSSSAAQSSSESTKTPARREVKEKFLVSMSKGERSVFKSFCALKGVSMNHFVMCAMDYFKEDLENGKVSISAHSYKRKES